MKRIAKEITAPFKGLTMKQKAIVAYFAASFCLVGSVAEAPAGLLILIVANFGNAVMMLKNVPLHKIEGHDPRI